MKNSDAYKVAIIEIQKNDIILEKTGGVEGFGYIPSGSINTTNGKGTAKLKIKVIGEQDDVNIEVYLTKQPNEDWKLIEMY